MANNNNTGECVRDILAQIIAAQNEVNEEGNCCTTGCDQSIADLISPTVEEPRPTTIPFILYCKGTCQPFIASSVIRTRAGGEAVNFTCLQSPIFRAKRFSNEDENCVVLELLEPVNAGGNPVTTGNTVCSFFPTSGTGPIRNLRATGVCITVSVNCFCGIACLEPVTPTAAV